MSQDHLDYNALVRSALLGVVREALASVARDGMPDGHELFVTLRTTAAGVDIPEWLHESYPEELTIALRRSFWDLEVDDAGFRVSLIFSGTRAEVGVPFSALKSFVDPPVQFALAFEPEQVAEPEAEVDEPSTGMPPAGVPFAEPAPALADGGDIVAPEVTSSSPGNVVRFRPKS